MPRRSPVKIEDQRTEQTTEIVTSVHHVVAVRDIRRITFPVTEGAPFASTMARVAREVRQAEAVGYRLRGMLLGVVEMVKDYEQIPDRSDIEAPE